MRRRGILCEHNVVVSSDNPWKTFGGEHYFCGECQEVRRIQYYDFNPANHLVQVIRRNFMPK